MVRVGIFGTRGELDKERLEMLVDEILEQCRAKMNSPKIEAVVSHASVRSNPTGTFILYY